MNQEKSSVGVVVCEGQLCEVGEGLSDCREVRKGARQSERARGSKSKPQLTYLHCPIKLKTTHIN